MKAGINMKKIAEKDEAIKKYKYKINVIKHRYGAEFVVDNFENNALKNIRFYNLSYKKDINEIEISYNASINKFNALFYSYAKESTLKNINHSNIIQDIVHQYKLNLIIDEINIDRKTARAAGKLSYEKKFIETSIHYINGTVVEIQEREITESEYNMETASKIVSIAAWPVTGKCNTYRIQVDNVWKTGVMPTVRSYDVIAIRHSTSFRFGGGIG